MKTTLIRFSVGLCLSAVMACTPALDPLGRPINNEAAYIATINALNTADQSSATAFKFSTSTPSLVAAAGQTLKITFTNGVVDAGSIANGIKLFTLADSTATTVYTETAMPLPATVTVTALKNATNDSVVSIPLDLTAAKSQILVKIDASALTANSGTKKLNQDGDKIGGEAFDDSLLFYVPVSQGTALVTGLFAISNQSLFTGYNFAAGAYANGNTTVTFPVSDSYGNTSGVTLASLVPTGAVTAYKYVPATATTAASWSTITLTPSYAAPTLTFTFPAALVTGEIYRFVVDTYLVGEDGAVTGGIVHKMLLNQFSPTRMVTSTVVVGATKLLPTTNGKAYTIGSVSFTAAGFDWGTTNQDFTISYSTNGAVTAAGKVTLNATTTNIATVVAHINTRLAAAGIGGIQAVQAGTTGQVRLETTSTGSGRQFTILPGGSALTTLGLTAGAYSTISMAVINNSGTVGTTLPSTQWFDLGFDADKLKADPTVNDVYVLDTTGTKSYKVAKVEKLTDRTFRFYMPTTAKITGTVKAAVLPSLVDQGPTSAVTDDLPYGDTTVSDLATYSNTWTW